MKTFRILTLAAVAGLGLAFAISATESRAEQKQRVSSKEPGENSKFTQRNVADVGDLLGHRVRIFELYRTFPNNAPVISGLKIKETRFADDIDGNGTVTNYVVLIMENGDEIFTRGDYVVQSAGGGKLAVTGIATIAGGTGKLAGIEGTLRSVTRSDPVAGLNKGQVEMEYWMDE